MLSQADTKDGYLATEIPYDFIADARIRIWMTWARADHNLCRFLADQFFESDLIISIDRDCGTLQHQILIDVPGERIKIIHDN